MRHNLNSKTRKQSQEVKKIKGLRQFEQKVRCKFIINFANKNFSYVEFSVLGRDLKFIDIPKAPRACF